VAFIDELPTSYPNNSDIYPLLFHSGQTAIIHLVPVILMPFPPGFNKHLHYLCHLRRPQLPRCRQSSHRLKGSNHTAIFMDAAKSYPEITVLVNTYRTIPFDNIGAVGYHIPLRHRPHPVAHFCRNTDCFPANME
jgi:hypothetical protein